MNVEYRILLSFKELTKDISNVIEKQNEWR